MGLRDGYILRNGDGTAELRRISVGRTVLGLLLCGLAGGLCLLHQRGHLRSSDGGPASDIATVLFAVALVVPGVALLTYRSNLRIDSLRGTIVTWWGFLRPWSLATRRVDEFDSVHVRKIVRSNGKGSRTYYDVSLNAVRRLPVQRLRSPVRARLLAERIARVVRKPLYNRIAGVETVRPPDQLDWSLRQRLLHETGAPSLPTQPPNSRVDVRPDGHRFLVRVPAPGVLRGGLVVLLLAAPGLLAAAAMTLTMAQDAPTWFRAFMAGIVLLPLVVVLAMAIKRGTHSTLLQLSPEEVSVTAVFPWAKITRRLDAREIEEVTISDPRRRNPILGDLLAKGAVTIMTDHEMVQLGAGLADDDRVYVANLIHHAVCLGAGPVPASTPERFIAAT